MKIKNDPKITPKWPQKWKKFLKNENFGKKWKFLKSSDNLEKNKKMKNLPENSPKWPQKSKIDFKNENFEKNEKF